MTVDAFLSRHPDFCIVPVSDSAKAVTADGINFDGARHEMKECRRFYPHISPGEGQFLCLMKKDSDGELNKKARALTVGALLLQAIATSIDALTAGINLAKDYSLMQYPYVLLSVAIIAIITLAICICGVKLGQKVGTKLSNKAGILGGSVLIFLGLKILITDIILPA